MNVFNFDVGGIRFPWFRKKEPQKLVVLLVEDDPNDIVLIGMALQTAGYETECAKTALEALGILHHNGRKFCFALIDIGLPYMDGITLSKKIHAAYPTLKLFLITGAIPLNMEPGFSLGLIVKPSEWLPTIRDIQTRWIGHENSRGTTAEPQSPGCDH